MLTRLRRVLQIKRMEMEARSFSADRARSLLVKVKEYKADLAALRTEFKKVRTPLFTHPAYCGT